MRVLIAALVPQGRPTGVAIYVRELVRAWATVDGAPELIVATREPGAFADVSGGRGVVKVWPLGPGPGTEFGRVVDLHVHVPRAARRAGADLILTPNFLAPHRTGGIPTAVVVQDLAFDRFPSTVPFGRRLYYLAGVRPSVRRAARILVSTRTVADELATYEPSVASRIRTAPLGVSPAHLETDSGPETPRDGGFLCVGTLEPRKNLARVLTAHGRLCRQFPEFPALRLVGAEGWGSGPIATALAGHPAPDKVVRLGYLSDEELVAEYRRARALVFCSIYEGFGLPLVEAMGHGCPILCSRGTALAEVAGEAALLADPLEVGEIEQGMGRLATDRRLASELAAAGRARAVRFSWAECARLTIRALEEVAVDARKEP